MKTLFIFISLISLNCFSAPLSPISSAEIDRRLKMFDYDNKFKVESFRLFKPGVQQDVYKIKLSSINPATKMPFFTEFYWNRPKTAGNPEPLPLIVISPPIVGVDPMEKFIATGLSAGKPPYYNTFILDYGEKINDKKRLIDGLNNSFITSITQGRLLLDFAETQTHFINTKKIACYGMSLGGIMSALLLEVDSRIDAAIIIVGGGNFPEILRNSVQRIVKGFRDARMKAENIKTLDDLEQKVRDSFLFDPIYFASRRPSRDVYQVIATQDTAVPTKNQVELWEAFRRPQKLDIDANHAPTVFKNLPKHNAIMKYLDWRFGLEK